MKIPSTLFLLVILGCSKNTSDPQQIIDQAMSAAGSSALENAKVEFEFRGRDYGIERRGGNYEMVRLWKDSVGIIRDEVTNGGFVREINGTKVEVADSMASKYTNSINSVFYFALLPFRLNDEAVQKKYVGEEEINGGHFDKVEITFLEEGGGKDHEDVFIYWVNKENSFIDYLAYSYETDGGGMRFRKAINPRTVNGVRIVDYINYKPQAEVKLTDMAKLYVQDELSELSRIELDQIIVELN